MGNSNDFCSVCDNVTNQQCAREIYMIQKSSSNLSETAPQSSTKRVPVLVKTGRNISSIQIKQNEVQDQTKIQEVNLNVSKKSVLLKKNEQKLDSAEQKIMDDNLLQVKSIFIRSVSSLKDIQLPLTIKKKQLQQNPQSPKHNPYRSQMIAKSKQTSHREIIHFEDQTFIQSDNNDLMLTLGHINMLQSKVIKL